MGNAISNLFKNPKYPGAALNTDRPERARLYAKLGNILMPGEMRQRRAKTKEIAPLAPHTIPEQDGYLILPPGTVAESEGALKACLDVVQKTDLKGKMESAKKRFLVQYPIDIRKPEYQAIKRLVLAPDILSTVSAYLGELPVIGRVDLWYSESEELEEGRSQQFHMDGTAVRQIKGFLYLDTVDEDSGAFSLLPALESEKIYTALRGQKVIKNTNTKLSDGQVYANSQYEEPVVAIGETGTIAFCDTDRCYHFGSRPASKPRLVLMFQYVPRFSRVTPYKSDFSLEDYPYRQTNQQPAPYDQSTEDLLLYPHDEIHPIMQLN